VTLDTQNVRAHTFSSNWRSCLLFASLEHKLCSGATTVQMQRPSASCAELYTCQPSFGLMVCTQTQACVRNPTVVCLQINQV